MGVRVRAPKFSRRPTVTISANPDWPKLQTVNPLTSQPTNIVGDSIHVLEKTAFDNHQARHIAFPSRRCDITLKKILSQNMAELLPLTMTENEGEGFLSFDARRQRSSLGQDSQIVRASSNSCRKASRSFPG
ncbi:hypothetical protein VTI28DRAFT_369 [Corynascus sepedonium]